MVVGDQLVLTFTEDLDDTSTPAASAFTVYIAGDTTGVNPSSVDTISGKTVTMTLATAVTSGQTVTLDYAQPATNPLRDESELDAPSFTGRTVTNSTGNNAATGAPTISGTAGVGKTLTAAKGTIADDDGTTKADDGDTGFDYTYQWVRVDASDNESGISGATAKTYTLAAADVDHTIKVEASFQDDLGNAESRTSAAYPSSGSVLPAISFDNINMNVVENVAGGAVTVTVNRTNSTVQSTVEYATRDNTAIDGEDYTAVSGTLTFASGETSKTFSVPILDDAIYEGTERFNLDLSNVSNAVLGSGNVAQVTVSDDETVPDFAMDPVTVDEGDGTMTVTLTATVALDVGVGFNLLDTAIGGTATRGEDYADILDGGTPRITLAAGEKSATFDIAIVDDSLDEADETVVLRWVEDSSIVPNERQVTFTGTIVDNDNSPATGAPGIDGVPQVGQTLTATAGNMADDDNLPTTTFPTGYAFQWVRVDSSSNESNVPGATSRTYVPAAADVGNTLKVEVTFTDGGGTPETLASAATAAVVARQENCATDRPDNDWCATMTVGEMVTGLVTFFGFNESNGALSDTTIEFGEATYTVSRLSASVVGGPNTTTFDFRLDAFLPRRSVFDLGGADFTANASSEQSTVGQYQWSGAADPGWLKGQKVTVSANLAPVVTAARVDGDELTLTFAEDLDTGSKPAASAFTVYVDGGAGANPSSVDTVSGKTVTMTLSAAVTSGQTVTLDYAPPATNPLQDESGIDAPSFTGRTVINGTGVTNAPATGQPGIDGVPQVGQTLTATRGTIADADNLPATTFPTGYTFQWVRAEADETNPQDIAGATSHTYAPAAADVGKKLLVEVSFTDGGGTVETRASGAMDDAVKARQESCAIDRAGADWCTTMTVGIFAPPGLLPDHGYDDGTISGVYGDLDDKIIDYNGKTNRVRSVVSNPAHQTTTFYYVALEDFVANGSVFDIGGQEFTTGDTHRLSSPTAYRWLSARPDWIEGQRVTVSANLIPVMVAGSVDGDRAELVFSEELDSSSKPAPDAFDVIVDAADTGNPAGVDIVGDTLILTLAAPVTSEQVVDVRYGVPASNPLQDVSGLAALHFYQGLVNDTGDPVTSNAPAAGRPSVSGTPQVGETLTAHTAGITDADGKTRADNGDSGFAWTYQWYTVDADGTSNRTPIPGETARTYSLTPADEDLRIIVEASFTDDAGGSEGPLASDPFPSSGTVAGSGEPAPDPETAPGTSGDIAVSVWYVYFDQVEYTAVEGGAGARVTVRLNAPWKHDEALTVYLSLVEHNGGAVASDYSGVPESVTFQPGRTETSFTVRATDDNADDDGEHIRFGINTRGYGGDGVVRFGVDALSAHPEDLEDLKIGQGPHTVTVRLRDNNGPKPVRVSFGAPAYTATEGGADATVTVRLSERPGRQVIVPLTVTHTDAGTGDYTGIPGSVTFGSNETERTFDVEAVDDGIDDDLESVTLGFEELPSGVFAGSPASTVVNLDDNDDAPENPESIEETEQPKLTLRFGAAETRRTEVREGISFSLAVTLEEAADTDIHIPLLIEYTGGATAADVTGLPATLTIEAGELRANVLGRMVDDADIDPDEGFTVTFGALPAGVKVHDLYDEAHFLIVDNDSYPEINAADRKRKGARTGGVCLAGVPGDAVGELRRAGAGELPDRGRVGAGGPGLRGKGGYAGVRAAGNGGGSVG